MKSIQFKFKTLTLALSGVCLSLSVAAADAPADESYALGASVGSYVSNQLYQHAELGENAEVAKVIEGFVDALKNQSKLSDDVIVGLLNDRAERLNIARDAKLAELAAEEKARSEAFLASNASNAKVTTLESGVQLEMLSEGKGEQPKPEDVVTVKYRGTLSDGSEFENTGDTPARFALMTVIPGLEQGIRQLREGGKAKILIPADLAYGKDGAGVIPPEAAVMFELELVKVEQPGKGDHGAMMGKGH